MMSRWVHAAAAASLLVLAGCGGGGGGGSTNYPLSISVGQSPITGSVPQIELPGSITFNASVSGTTTASTIYVVVLDSAGTFEGTPNVSQVGTMQYQATMPLPDTLTMGSYPGNLTISLCADANCATVLGRTVVPYVVTIAENPVVTGSFSRASVALTAVSGDETVTYPLGVSAPASTFLNHARFSDAADVLRLAGASQTIPAFGGSSTDIEITVSPDVLPGTYSGTLDMSYCRGMTCDRMYRGVTQLPYTVTVYPQTNLKALSPLPGAADWTVLQGSPARTGHVAVTLNPANFSPRWLWRSADPLTFENVLEPVNAAGKVFTVAAPSATYNITPTLFAIDEASGTVSWQQPIPDPGTGPWNGGLGPFTPPAIAGNSVYLARTVGSSPDAEGTVLSFGVADGTAAFTPPIFAQPPAEFADYVFELTSANNWMSPVHMTPLGSSMLLTGRRPDYSRTQMAIDLATGAHSEPWSVCIGSLTSPAFAGAAAVDGSGAAYLATDTGLLLADTCEMISTSVSIADGFGPVVVPGTTTVVAVGQGNLVAFDTATQQIKWSAPKSPADVFVGSPSVTGDTIFVQNNGYGSTRLEARRESDGVVLWTWQPPWKDEIAFMGNVVSTNNLVFVSTRRGVYAIDRTTHQAVWTYPYAGKLSISANGVLYVRRGFVWFGKALAAINLQ